MASGSLFQNGPVDADQDTAFSDSDVVAIVSELILRDDTKLVRITKTFLIASTTPTRKEVNGLIGMASIKDPSLVASALAIANRAASINSHPESSRARLRGAVLERLVFELVKARPTKPSVLREQMFFLLPAARTASIAKRHDGWSRPKEVIVDGGVLEVYECKRHPGRPPRHAVGAWRGFDQEDVDELTDIADAGIASGRPTRPIIAIFDDYTTFYASLRRLVIEPMRLYYATADELLELKSGTPDRVLE